MEKGETVCPKIRGRRFFSCKAWMYGTENEGYNIRIRYRAGLPAQKGEAIRMNIYDILGPVMIGPSSSHTAGAVRIGLITRRLLGEEPAEARILLSGSFGATGRGHGTDRALAAGLLGMKPDDIRVPDSLSLAEEQGLKIVFELGEIKEAHPNTARLLVIGENGKRLEVQASSLGGGRIAVDELEGIRVSFTGEAPTLIVRNVD